MPKAFDLFDSEACCSDDDYNEDEDEDNDQCSTESMRQFINDSSSVFSSSSETTKDRSQHKPTRILFSSDSEYEYEVDDKAMSASDIQQVLNIQESSKKAVTLINEKKLYNMFKTKSAQENNNSKTKVKTKVTSKDENLPGFSQFPLTEWSLTVSKLGSDVDITALPLMYKFLEQYCSKGAISTEVGKRAHNLHLQGVFQTKYPKTDVFKKKLNKFLKAFLPNKAVGYRVVCKPLTSGQDFISMIGYVLKDEGQAWFQTMTFNVTRYFLFLF